MKNKYNSQKLLKWFGSASLGLLLTKVCFAQAFMDDPNRPNTNRLSAEGKMVSIQLVLGEPIRIFVVGREEAKVDLTDMKLTVRRLKPYPGKVLTTDRDGNSFTISEGLELNKETDIEVTTELKKKKESFKFNLEEKKP